MYCTCTSENSGNCCQGKGKMGHKMGHKMGKGHINDYGRNKNIQMVEDNNLKILVELPGIDKSELKITAKSDKLVLKANYKDDVKHFYPDSSINQSIQLKENVDPTTSSAKYSDGILIVSFQLENLRTEVPIE